MTFQSSVPCSTLSTADMPAVPSSPPPLFAKTTSLRLCEVKLSILGEGWVSRATVGEGRGRPLVASQNACVPPIALCIGTPRRVIVLQLNEPLDAL